MTLKWLLRSFVSTVALISLTSPYIVAEVDPLGTYEILDTTIENELVVASVKVTTPTISTKYLFYGPTMIGAEFDDPVLKKLAAFPGFAIMQSVLYFKREDPIERAIQIGLGIGTVPKFLRANGVPTDVVELSDAVVNHAVQSFEYEKCEITSDMIETPCDCDESGDDFTDCMFACGKKECPHGRTFIMDGLKFIAQPAPQADEDLYDVFIVDVYTGFNPLLFFTQEIMQTIEKKWLSTGGVLVMNFVGKPYGSASLVAKSIYKTLQTVFPNVKCFREMEEREAEHEQNLVFFASSEPIAFKLPTTQEYIHTQPNTYHHIIANFPNWEVLNEDVVEMQIGQNHGAEEVSFSPETVSLQGRVLTNADYGQNDDEFQEIHQNTMKNMKSLSVGRFKDEMWNDLATILKEHQ